MRRPIILSLALAFAVLLPFMVQAVGAQQAGKGAGQIAAARRALPCLQRALNAAGVTDAQKAEMQAIRQKYAPQFKAIRDSDLPPAEKKAKAAELTKAAREEALSVLTPEQQAAVREFIQKNCRPAPGPRPGPRVVGCLQRALDAAGVTADQKAQMKAIREKYAPQLKALRDSDLPPAEKRAKAAEILRTAKAEAMAVLTPEQQAAVKEFVKKNCGPMKPDKPVRPPAR